MSDSIDNYNYKVLNENSNYYITDTGKLYSIRSRKFLNGQIMSTGYLRYTISENGISSRYWAHRLVAEYFVENPMPDKFNIVNHKDLNKLNNSASNLEWTDVQGNTQHAANNNLLCYKRKREYLEESLDDEQWVPVINYPNYFISSYGRIKNQKDLLLKYWRRGNSDYQLISLVNDDGKKNLNVHILVYYSFNPEEYAAKDQFVIDHIDGNRINNKLDNLRKITQSENVKSAYYSQKVNSRAIPIRMFDLKGNFIKDFPSAAIAAEELGIPSRSIRKVCRGEMDSTHGYTFKDLK